MSEKRVKTEGLNILEHTSKNTDYNEIASKGADSTNYEAEVCWVSPYERLQHWVDAETVVSFKDGQFFCNSKKLNNILRKSSAAGVQIFEKELPQYLQDKVRERYSPEFIREELDDNDEIDI